MLKNDIDAENGYQAGMLGKVKILGRLYDRNPPEHLYKPENSERLALWKQGYLAAQSLKSERNVVVTGCTKSGQIIKKYKGWSVERGKVTAKFAEMGCIGDVVFEYNQGAKKCKEIQCGI